MATTSVLEQDLSPEQQTALVKFRDAIADLKTPERSDRYLLLWLKARNFNVTKAETMIRKSMAFREEMEIDSILQYDPPEVLKKYSAGGIFGEDRDRDPVYYCAVGNLDFKGLYRSVKKKDILKERIQGTERLINHCKRLTEERGKTVNTWTIVLDMENLSYQRHFYWPMIHIVNETLAMFDSNYPETCKRSIVVKAPKIFPVAYNIAKHFIDESTRQKVIVAGANWKEELQKYISPDNLPEFYGGTRREPDPTCSKYIKMGGDVPDKYFFTNNLENPMEDMDVVTVNRGSSVQVQYEVDTPGTLLRWEVVTKGYDIGFGLYHKPFGQTEKLHAGEMAAKIPTERKDSHVAPETGVYTCTETGIYVVRFDNTYSWTKAKEVFYSIQLFPSDTEICDTRPDEIADEVLRMSISKESVASDDSFHSATSQETQELPTGKDKLQGLSTTV
ncbi:SEC14-like protein 2 isoform X2 [Dysidea avara]|uniref:SEC14-like protein 2 isoform X2 n=1 Tax=Dysidea avara TaxID=196820 RepID=UPI00331B1447